MRYQNSKLASKMSFVFQAAFVLNLFEPQLVNDKYHIAVYNSVLLSYINASSHYPCLDQLLVSVFVPKLVFLLRTNHVEKSCRAFDKNIPRLYDLTEQVENINHRVTSLD